MLLARELVLPQLQQLLPWEQSGLLQRGLLHVLLQRALLRWRRARDASVCGVLLRGGPPRRRGACRLWGGAGFARYRIDHRRIG